MKAHLYALLTKDACSWHVSLDIRADRDYYLGELGSSFKLRVLEPSLSFGQACEIKDQISPKLDEDKHLAYILQKARKLGLSIPEKSQWKLWDWSPPHEETTHDTRQSLDALLQNIVAALRGRFLHMEEFKALLDHQGLGTYSESLGYVIQFGRLKGLISIEPGVHVQRRDRKFPFLGKEVVCHCKRCGTNNKSNAISVQEGIEWTNCPHCGTLCAYCEACLTMGRTRYCSPLISAAADSEGKGISNEAHLEQDLGYYLSSWGLSDVQKEASGLALSFLKTNENLLRENNYQFSKKRFLIWAVTGAGKTEMIFPLIRFMLDRGGRVAVATPRRDVVLELKPRLERVFPQTRVVTLYGGSEQRWDLGELFIATTHQLMRFREAFDLVIVDEIDAFPYHNNPMLQYAANQACTAGGAYIFLSATPPIELQRAVKRKQLPYARVAARFHRHKLPVPRVNSSPYIKTNAGGEKVTCKAKAEADIFEAARGSNLYICT